MIKRFLCGLALVAFTAGLALGQTTRPAKSDDLSGSLSKSDLRFVTEAAQGGLAEVALGKLAVDKATAPDVKAFGQRMVTDHTKANDQLKTLASSKGVTLPVDLDPKHQNAVDRLSKLSGSQFDHQYMAMMVSDHNKDVAEFRKAARSAQDSDVKAFAAQTLPTLEEHQRLAKDLAAKNGPTTKPAKGQGQNGKHGY